MSNRLLVNLHTHTTFCDGKSTPEEVVRSAIEKGFSAIGFSAHGTTPFDLTYCMQDTEGYIAEIDRLKEKYRKEIRIYLGIEEDALALVDRSRFEYLIGSAHYCYVDGVYYSIDSGAAHRARLLAACGGDPLRMADLYYRTLCDYLRARKPDVVGHFDLITKYDESDDALLLQDPRYQALAERYLTEAMREDRLFEINTGAMLRGIRTSPYPAEHLLRLLQKGGARILLSSDSHHADTLDGFFPEMRQYLYDLGFRQAYALTDQGFVPYWI